MNGRQVGRAVRRALVSLGFTVVAIRVAAQAPLNLQRVGQIGGACWAVEVVGRYAYITEGENLVILDVWNPSSPVPVARLSLGNSSISAIRVKNGLACIAASTGASGWPGCLYTVDVTNPRAPRLRGSYQTRGYARDVFVSGSLAYFVDDLGPYNPGIDNVLIIDVSDPTSPTLRGSFFTDYQADNVHVTGGTAYVATEGGMYIFDVTNPSLSKRRGFYARYNDSVSDVFVTGGLAYFSYVLGMDIVDVTNPSSPTLRGRTYPWSYPGSVKCLFVAGNLAYLGGDADGLVLIDVSTPSSPTLRGSCHLTDLVEDVVVSSGTAYVADLRGGFSIVDVRNPSNPTVRATYDTLSNPSDVNVTGGVAYVANGRRGFKTVGVLNPPSPRVLGALAMSGYVSALNVAGKLAYLACGDAGLQIVDVTTPSAPRLRGSFDTPGWATDVFVSGGVAYVADADRGLAIIDVTNPSTPRLRGSLWVRNSADFLAVSGGTAYIAGYSNRLHIVDVRNPAFPVLRSTFVEPSNTMIFDVSVSNGLACLVISTGSPSNDQLGLDIVDVTSPDAPRLRGRYLTSSNAVDLPGGVYLSDGLAYAVLDELRILDLRNPSMPVLRGYFPDWGSRLCASGDLVYLVSGGGLEIYRFTRPTSARHWQLYP